jgi:hypothetical protein
MSKRLTTEIFIEKANRVHNNIYDYSLVNYIKNSIKIEIICKVHGSFMQIPNDHLSGAGCPECVGCKRITTQSFIERASIIHNNFYDYSLVNFKSVRDQIEIICPKHGVFSQMAHNHLCGATCYKCGKESMATTRAKDREDFIIQASLIHENKYDYSKVEYVRTHTKIIIICSKHGEFRQTPHNHLTGQGCPVCKHGPVSKKEIDWLNLLNIPNEFRQATIVIDNKKYRVDAFDSTTNTIYEFYGDFWHGNPELYNKDFINKHSKISFGELYNKTMERENIYKRANYNIVSIWEHDFKKQQKI